MPITKIKDQGPTLFVFRRDLRLEDNTALNLALKAGAPVIPLFVADPRQINPHPYRSDSGLQFLAQSLLELHEALKQSGSALHLVRGTAEETIPRILKDYGCSALSFNRDYTPFSRSRDGTLEKQAEVLGVRLLIADDTLIDAPGRVLKDNGTPYTVYTPYYKRAIKNPPVRPAPRASGSFLKIPELCEASPKDLLPEGATWNHPDTIKGGRSHALDGLQQLSRQEDYQKNRDFPALSATTRLSPHHKFGTISIRETFARACDLFGKECTLVRELYWRDFFTQIAWHFPHVFERSFNPAYDQVQWHDHADHFQAWADGMTGFPIVDAGMRELNSTGYMHNRVRMIVASFLTKDLHISWREGERYFASRLIDYDPAVNNGSWQWAASTGCDAQPYFRIFNPWLQQLKFDPECVYIKRWIPELRSLERSDIHGLAEKRPLFLKDYPAPIIDHSREKRITEQLFNQALKGNS